MGRCLVEFVYPYGATPIDPDEADVLLLPHISTQSELNRWEQDNIYDAVVWLSDRKIKRVDVSFLCRVHKEMFKNIWRWAGKFRKTEKNIGVEFYKITSELNVLCGDLLFWIENETYIPDEIAYRFHHRLVQIHPFVNGNGRHARLMTDVVLEKFYGIEPFSWGSSDLTAEGDSRKRYIDSLRLADQGDYSALAEFVRS